MRYALHAEKDSMRNLARLRALAAAVPALALAVATALPARADFVAFESGHVRPLALSPDGTRLFAVNTPDNRLEIFAVAGNGSLTKEASVSVGLEPVAVAARSATEVWVVNHLSDSVSIVDVGASPPRVVRTLLVGDEPRDIVFAGPQSGGVFGRAFVTTARRGQNLPASVPPSLTTEGTPRALVFVFDAENLGNTLAGNPIRVIELFGDTPRALAATEDGATVYAAIFHSGNQTTALNEGLVCNEEDSAPCDTGDDLQMADGLPGGQVPGRLPPPRDNADGVDGPEVGLIVKLDRNDGIWKDELGRNWNNAVRFSLPDLDVFAIDADALTPSQVDQFAHAGTVLFNMIVNPATGNVYVTNTDAQNEVRFEGPGEHASTTVRGHLHESRITVIDPDDGTVEPRHLNKHIPAQAEGYRTEPMPVGVGDDSLATPLGMAFAGDGTVYVAAFGSSKVGRFSAAELEDDSFVPDADTHIEVSGGGPTGLALNDADGRLYVLTRFDNAVKVIDTTNGTEIAAHPLHNPEPPVVRDGRTFLYDAHFTSSNGEASCSSCHVFADFDSLGWDLGNPDEVVVPNPNPMGVIGNSQPFHPMKGPMTTQTLRGMAHHGPMHWRGDRTGGGAAALNEQLAFEAFNPAFEGLLGRDEGEIPAADMTAFARFILEVTPPPNPIRNLDNSLTAAQADGRGIFLNRPGTDLISNCDGCHRLNPAAGFFGTGGETTFENESQEFKVAHLTNAYQKIGMFGLPEIPFVNTPDAHQPHQGDQVRGFGFLHDGSISTVFDFLNATVFVQMDQTERRNVEQFVLAFDAPLAPIVGQQVTVTPANAGVGAVGQRVTLMRQRADTSFVWADHPGVEECDLVVKGNVAGLARGYLFDPQSNEFQPDRADEDTLTQGQLFDLADVAGQELTFTCAPPGSGERIALDRDADTFFDRDELDFGSDPEDDTSTPVPEPAQALLMAVGAAVLRLARRRRSA
jgi:DNA-binding beta-propeller fold protein YncE